jgi:hypothetical protein
MTGCVAPPFLISVLDGAEWSALHLGHFTPGENLPWYSLDRRLGGPQGRSGRCGEEKNVASVGNRIPAVQLVARHYAD